MQVQSMKLTHKIQKEDAVTTARVTEKAKGTQNCPLFHTTNYCY